MNWTFKAGIEYVLVEQKERLPEKVALGTGLKEQIEFLQAEAFQEARTA